MSRGCSHGSRTKYSTADVSTAQGSASASIARTRKRRNQLPANPNSSTMAVIIALSTTFGFHFLARTHRYVAWKHGERLFDGRVLALWFVLLVMVAAQMAHFIGPLDTERGLFDTERGFFLAELFDI